MRDDSIVDRQISGGTGQPRDSETAAQRSTPVAATQPVSSCPTGQPAPHVPIGDDLDAIREELRKQSIQIEYAQRYQQVLSDLKELKGSIDEKWRYFKIAAVIASAVLSLGGLIGIKSLSDAKAVISKQITDSVEKDVEKTREFYTDLMAGSTLFVRKQYAAAVPRLLKCFHGHEYDKGVLIPLLSAVNLADDWDDAKLVITTLRADAASFEALNDPTVYTIVGSMEVQMGMTDLGDGDGSKDQANKTMDFGYDLLTKAFGIAGRDIELKRHILTNYWLYYVAKRDFAEALKVVQQLQGLPKEVRVYSWTDISQHWKCMLALEKLAEQQHTDTIIAAEKQWHLLSTRFLPDGY